MSGSGFQLRQMTISDREEVTRLIFHSTNQYYESIGRDPIFEGDELTPIDMFDVYEQIDPGQGIVAVDNVSQQIIGSCFVHPRETHVSLGIMNAHPDHFGRGVARAILSEIIERAQSEAKPVRLVSSCFNLDSYSLYSRAGFVPFATFQDMYLEVPAGGLAHPPPNDIAVRPATLSDVESMAELEQSVSGISREADYRYFINNPDALWHVSVAESSGTLQGFLVSCSSQAFNMIGPGVMRNEDQAAALLYDQLNQHSDRSPVFLVPVSCAKLARHAYSWGGRNCEMHVAQCCGEAQPFNGVAMPTFLPETG